jgi:glutathione S-transferase
VHTDKLGPSELQEKLGRIPLAERRERWAKVARGGFGEPDFEAGRKAASFIIARMEEGFGNGPWLMGEQYTLADIDLMPFVDRFSEFYPEMLNATAAPKVSAWLARMRERPAVKAVWATDEAPAKAA